MYPSSQKIYYTENTKLKKTIYKNKKANYLSTYRDLEREKCYF